MEGDDDIVNGIAGNDGDKPVAEPRPENALAVQEGGQLVFNLGGFTEGIDLDRLAKATQVEASEDVFPKKVLDIVVNGKTLRELVAPLEVFWRNHGVPHEAAKNDLSTLFPGLRAGNGFDYDSELAELGVGSSVDFMASTQKAPYGQDLSPQQRENREITGDLSDAVLACWSKEERVFLDLPPRSSPHDFTPIALAMKCPRLTDSKKVFEHVMPEEEVDRPLEALRYQVMFSELSRLNLSKGKGANRHREVYALAQIAAKVGEYGERVDWPGRETKVFAPSVALVLQFKNDDERRKFINARLSLLFPDNIDSLISDNDELQKIVQEDFITCDIIAFTQAAGLYEEYKLIFEALFYYRQLQFFQDFHLDPDIPEKDRHVRVSLVKLLQRICNEKEGGRLPSLSSFGCGNGLLEKILLSQGLVESVSGVDKHDGGKTIVESVGDKFKTASVAVPANEDSLRIKVKVLEAMSPEKVVMAADSLHETDDPRGYLLALFSKKVEPGGFLYISDPVHCSAVDDVTNAVLNPYDSNKHPGSMLSLESYLEVISYLRTQGAVVEYVTVVPGSYAGYIDTFSRLHLVIRKPEIGKALPYAIPKVGDENVRDEDKSIFEVFPFNLIPREDRKLFLADIDESTPGLYVPPAEINHYVIAKLLKGYQSGSKPKPHLLTQAVNALQSIVESVTGDTREAESEDDDGVDKFLRETKCFPYRDVSRLLEVSGATNIELMGRNQKAAEVIALAKLLKQKLNIDIYPELKNQPGWERFIG